MAKVKNIGSIRKKIVVVIREKVRLEPGEEIEFEGEIELE